MTIMSLPFNTWKQVLEFANKIVGKRGTKVTEIKYNESLTCWSAKFETREPQFVLGYYECLVDRWMEEDKWSKQVQK